MLCLKALSMPMTFDEYFHAHYLWLVSIGRVPHVDFWCGYPGLGYVIARPFFLLFHESIYTLIALRYFGVFFFIGIAIALAFHARHLRAGWLWGVLPLALMVTVEIAPFIVNFRTDSYAAFAAILALTLMFREPSASRMVSALFLSALSVLIMPKYVYPLAGALTEYFCYGSGIGKARRRTLLLSAAAGGVMALAVAQILLATAGVRLWDDLYWSPLFMQRYFAFCARTDPSLRPQLTTVSFYFSKYWWIATPFAAGLACWLVTELKRRQAGLWVGMAVIAGLAVYWGSWKAPFLQFFVPGLFCLALFVPYIGCILKRPAARLAGLSLLIALSSITVVAAALRTQREYASGEASRDFAARQELLSMIPRTEKVVGIYKTHPCFREDLTFVTYDEYWGRPRGFVPVLPENSCAYACFQPDYLQQRLAQSPPPACIALHADNYPPHWNELLIQYLASHSDLYVKAEILDKIIFLRKDIVK